MTMTPEHHAKLAEAANAIQNGNIALCDIAFALEKEGLERSMLLKSCGVFGDEVRFLQEFLKRVDLKGAEVITIDSKAA